MFDPPNTNKGAWQPKASRGVKDGSRTPAVGVSMTKQLNSCFTLVLFLLGGGSALAGQNSTNGIYGGYVGSDSWFSSMRKSAANLAILRSLGGARGPVRLPANYIEFAGQITFPAGNPFPKKQLPDLRIVCRDQSADSVDRAPFVDDSGGFYTVFKKGQTYDFLWMYTFGGRDKFASLTIETSAPRQLKYIFAYRLNSPTRVVRVDSAAQPAGLRPQAPTGSAPPVNAAEKPRDPLSKEEIIKLLKNGVPPVRVESLARQYGVSFELTGEAENQLQQAGAPDSLLEAVRTSRIAAKPTGSASSPALIVQSTPGGAQVYVDDEPVGTTSREGRLKLSQVAPGEHTIRVSLPGYRDHTQQVSLSAGEALAVAANLEPLKPTSGPAPNHTEASKPLQPTVSDTVVAREQPSGPPLTVDKFDLSGFPRRPTNFEEQQVVEDIRSATTPELKAGAHERLARYYEKRGDARRAEQEYAKARYWRNPGN